MRNLILFLVAMLLATPLWADTPTTTPTVADSVSTAPLVLVFPFRQMGDMDKSAWLSDGMQEDMIAQLNKTGWVQARAMPDSLLASETSKALDAGKTAGASMVIFGSYQIVGPQVRVSGQLTQVDTGKVLTVLQTTGSSLDVFKVEDVIDQQLAGMIAQIDGPKDVQPIASAEAPQAAPQQTTVYLSQPYTQPSTDYVAPPSAYYDYGYPGVAYPYSYGYYPGVYFGGGIVGGGFNRGFRSPGFGRVGGMGHVGGFGHAGGGFGGGHGGGRR